MKLKILLTGARGQIGSEIACRGRSIGHDIVGLDSSALDITDAERVRQTILQSDAHVVINAAAYTAVDRAEEQPLRAYAVNREGPGHLAAACAQKRIPLLHISTDYVFDGKKQTAYVESDKTAPLGIYGDSKWQGEQQVRQLLQQHLILRVSWVFGSHGSNFVKTMIRLAREREQLKVVADQQGCPTYAGDIADTLLRLAEKTAFSYDSAWGTYHYCNVPAVSWHGFAEQIIEQARYYEPLTVNEVIPITTADYPTAAERPANSVLDSSRLKETFGIAPRPWQHGLSQMLQALMPQLAK